MSPPDSIWQPNLVRDKYWLLFYVPRLDLAAIIGPPCQI